MPTIAATTQDTFGRFVTWNVWDNRDLARRIPLLVEGLSDLDSSHGALQECSKSEYVPIFNALGRTLNEPAWTRLTSSTPNNGSLGLLSRGNRVVFWRPSLWELVDTRGITLQPDDRGVPAVLLRGRATGLLMWLWSAHLSYTAAKDDERDDQARQLVGFLDSLGPLPKIGGADLNDAGKVGSVGSVRTILKRGGYLSMIDLTGRAPVTHRSNRRIDETLVTKDYEVRDLTTRFDLEASDHAAELVQWTIKAQSQPPPPTYLGPFRLLTNVWAVQHNPQHDPRLPKDGTRKPYGRLGYRPKGFVLRNVTTLVQAKDSAGQEHTYAVTATGNRYALGGSPNKRNWVEDLSR